MNSQSTNEKSNVVIFLDIDGVLNYVEPIFKRPLEELSQEEMKLRTGSEKEYDSVIEKLVNNSFFLDLKGGNCEITRLMEDKAATHLFSKPAVAALDDLILRMQALANVHIVLSSDWRLHRSIEELKETFSLFGFSEFIIDKTTEEKNELYANWKDFCAVPHFDLCYKFKQMHRALSKMSTDEEVSFKTHTYNLDKRCRASEINEWLNHHPEYLNYLIFDDIDSHLSENFGDKFIPIQDAVLTSEHTEKAYGIFLKCLNK